MNPACVVDAVRTALKLTPEAAQQIVYGEESYGISYLKVNELKDIIRTLKGSGYDKVKLSVTANKPELVDMLKKAVKLETPGTSASAIPSNTVNQHHIASQQQNSTVQAGTPGPYAAVAMASNSSAANVVSPPAARGYPMGVMPAAAASSSAHKSFVYVPPAPAAAAGSSSSVVPSKATNPAPIIPVPSAALPRPSAPAVTSAKKKKATKAPKPLPHPAHIYVPRAGDPPGLRERMLAVLCTPHKIDAYRVLKAVPGVSVMEVLTELAAHDNTETELDPDFLLFNIVARRETGGGAGGYGDGQGEYEDAGEEDAYVRALQEQEDRDMDRAILESEKERDVIQQRKRSRVEELRSGKDGYLTSAEFQKSILLFGCGDCGTAVVTSDGQHQHSGAQFGSPKSPRRSLSAASPLASKSSSSSSAVPVRSSSSSSSGAQKISFLRRDAIDSLIPSRQKQQQQRSEASQSSSNGGGGHHCKSNGSQSSSCSGISAGQAAANSSKCSSEVVDLTCDSSDDEKTPQNPPRSPAPVSPTPAKKGAAPEVVDMSRCKVLHKLAELLDALSDFQQQLGLLATHGEGGGNRSSSSSGSSSSSSASALSGLRQRVYDVSSLNSCCSPCLTKLAQLRPVVSRLLLLEVNAIKFYSKASSAYLIFLARRVDKKLLCRSLDDAMNSAAAGVTDIGDDCIFTVPSERIFMRYGAIADFLSRVSAKFERGMYKLPEDNQLVPALFRKPKLSCFAHALASSIDTDGIEVVDAVSPQDMIGYQEALLTSDEESVAAEPSPYNSDED